MTALRLVSDDVSEPVCLAEGIALLERGGPRPGLMVDLGHGDMASADGHLGQAGLTQRLLGHRLLCALAGDPHNGLVDLPERILDMTPETKELLDLARPLD